MELTGYTVQPQRRSARSVEQLALVQIAATKKFGGYGFPQICDDSVLEFWKNYRINSARMMSHEPVEKGRTIVNIATKEYINCGSEQDESTLSITNQNAQAIYATATSYEWSPIEGVSWGLSADVGAKIAGSQIAGVAAAWPGVTAGVCLQWAVPIGSEIFGWSQSEKIVVPPRTKVKAVITTYAIRHELQFTAEFAFPTASKVAMRYESFCLPCSNWCFVTASEILRGLPEYREENDWVYFTQEGKLSWTGEGYGVMKTEEPLLQ